ncbi:MAG TPA: GntR family transcriptional regulator [Anaerolineaceae bacterium]|nr:GntR family transcriptional regulator [Anaerolineaceae bacterium]
MKKNTSNNLEIKVLDKGSHIPLYLQLANQLIGQMRSGALKPGDRLPSEHELTERLNVSRITARQAIETLLEKGLIYREQGRGTFMAEMKMHGIRGFTSFTEDMRSRGLVPGSRIIKMELVHVEEKLQQDLKVASNDLVIHLVRLRLADGEPVAFQVTYLPYKICPGLENEDLSDRSLFQVLRDKYYVYPVWTEAVVRALTPTPEEAELLRIGLDEPVLAVNGVTYTESFDVVEVVRTVYLGNAISLYMGRQRLG